MDKKIDVLIKGQGIVGMTLALHLSKARIDVGMTLDNASSIPSPKHDGRYFALNPQSKRLLESIGCWPQSQDATALKAMQIFGDQGSTLEFDSSQSNTPLAWIVKASSLSHLLSERIHSESHIHLFEHKDQPSADLTLICEGKHSAMKKELGITFDVIHYHQHAFSTLIDTGTPHEGKAYQWFLQQGSSLEIFGLLPCGGSESSLMSLVWSMPSQKALMLHSQSDSEVCVEMEKTIGKRFPQLKIMSPSSVWPLSASKAHHWVGKLGDNQTWALLGDSAHTVHPLAGMGLNLGLGDVSQMIELFKIKAEKEFWRRTNDLTLLKRYERARKSEILNSWYFCDALYQLFSHPSEIIKSLRNLGLFSVQRLNFIKTFFIQQAGSTSA